MGWMIWGSNPIKAKKLLSLPNSKGSNKYQMPLRKPPYLSLRPRAPHSTSTIHMEEWGTHFS